MTATGFCSDPRKHAAFGHHQRGPEGQFCTSCRVLPPAPDEGGSEAGTGTEVNLPLATTPTPPDPIPDTSSAETAQRGQPAPCPLPCPPTRLRKLQAQRSASIAERLRADAQRHVWCGRKCRKNASSRRTLRARPCSGRSALPPAGSHGPAHSLPPAAGGGSRLTAPDTRHIHTRHAHTKGTTTWERPLRTRTRT